MYAYNTNKTFLARIIFFSHVLMSCLSPGLGPDKQTLESSDDQSTISPSSSMVAFTKQENKAQELGLQNLVQEEERVEADKRNLSLENLEAALSSGNQLAVLPTGKEGKEVVMNISLPSSELGMLGLVPKDILKVIFSYVGSKEMGKIRALNKFWYKLTTGYEVPGMLGVNCKPQASMLIDGLFINKRVLDFEEVRGLSPENVPSFPWYRLVGEIRHIPSAFWPYISGTQVHTLNLVSNAIGADGVQALAAALPSTQIQSLDLRGNQIGADGARMLAVALPSSQVHSLYLGFNNLGADGVRILTDALPSTQVHTLNLYGNQIGADGARALAAALPSSQMHKLDLSGNQIGAEGARALTAALPSSQMHTLDLSGNQIGAEGARSLAAALPSSQVHTLNLKYNQIGPDGARALAAVLPFTQVHSLYLGSNQIGADGVRSLAAALSSSQVHTLDLSNKRISLGINENYNNIGADGAQALAAVLPSSQVRRLNLAYNQIGAEMESLLRKENPRITWYF